MGRPGASQRGEDVELHAVQTELLERVMEAPIDIGRRAPKSGDHRHWCRVPVGTLAGPVGQHLINVVVVHPPQRSPDICCYDICIYR